MADGGYKLEHIIHECMNEKFGSQELMTDGSNVYEETWEALNLWIESRLKKKKGASIGMLGTFTWETKKEDGQTLSRPIFLIGDTFAKDHKVKRHRILSNISTESNEEINYSKLAIKYSKSLTKDLAFCSIRDIIKKIGEYIERSVKFSIAFKFGVFKSNDRKVKFEFDYSRFAKILPDNFRPDFFKSHTSRSGDNNATERREGGAGKPEPLLNFPRDVSARDISTASSTASLPALRPQTLSPININRKDKYAAEIPSLNLDTKQNDYQVQAAETSNYDYRANTQQTSGSNQQQSFNSPTQPAVTSDNIFSGQLSPGTIRILESLREQDLAEINPPPRLGLTQRRVMACETVQEQAYLRCLQHLQQQANNDKDYSADYREKWILDNLQSKAESKQKVKDLESFLKSQIKEYYDRKGKDKEERKEARINHELPGYIPSDGGSKKGQRTAATEIPPQRLTNEELVKSLDQQIRFNRDKKVRTKKQQLDEEREYLDHVAIEMELQHAAERAAHLEKQKILLEAWEREAHIRNLKRLQRKGGPAVTSYIRNNMTYEEDGEQENFTASKFRPSTTMSKISVGFDVRKTS